MVKKGSFLFLGLFFLLLTQPACAGTLYSSGVAWNGTNGQYGISTAGAYVTDAFTLASASTVTSIDLGLWDYGSQDLRYDPASLSYKIQNAVGTVVSSGNVALTTLDTQYYGSGFREFLSEFSLNVSLDAGTYYLTLSQGLASNGESIGWAFNQFGANNVAWVSPHAPFNSPWLNADGFEESFIINGEPIVVPPPPPSPTPEPATLLLIGLGLAGLAGARKRIK